MRSQPSSRRGFRCTSTQKTRPARSRACHSKTWGVPAAALASKLKAGSSSVFVCPVATDPGSNHFLPYGMNMNLCPWILPQATKFTEVAQPSQVVAMADAPGPYASTFPSKKPYSVLPRHSGRATILFLAGQVNSFAANYVGCGVGDPNRADVRWLTGTDSDNSAGNY